jgi:hypothetical protein
MRMTPRQLGAWAELIDRDELQRDAKLLQLMRVAEHGDKSSYNKFRKKMEEKGQ